VNRKVLLVALIAMPSFAQRIVENYDESKVPPYTLPALLTLENGQPVRDAKTWTTKRRAEILELYRREVFGRSPANLPKLDFEVRSVDRQALGGKAVRKLVTIWLGPRGASLKMDLLMYLPASAKKPAPAFLSLGFSANQAVSSDPGIPLADEWVRDPVARGKKIKQPANDKSRGADASRWGVEEILNHGYALATVYYEDIEPDFDGGLQYGVRALLAEPKTADAWGAIGAWAWGLSRAMDYLEKDREIDAKRVAVIGHSRLGKTALWAGAQDTRFSIVISNDSGEGGAAISRRQFGEQVRGLNANFPHWFCGNFKKYNDREDQMPVDSHMLLALIAPRPLYVASAAEDLHADPRGEFLGAVNASPVYELLGKKGLGTDQMPPIHQPIMHTVGYHVRAGKHDITAYDWEQYLKFADMHWSK
jgi:hypothetical protein